MGGEEHALKPTWRQDAGGYLRGVRGCGSSATRKRERRRKRELEKSASQTRPIVEIFSAQLHNSNSENAVPTLLPSSSPRKNLHTRGGTKEETMIESQTRAVHELGELLRLKTEQINKYRQILAPKSNYYRWHQMIQSFLWV